jgi:hypothetical protein
MLTAAQCRAARALVDWPRKHLAQASGVEELTIRNFERKLQEPDEDAKRRLVAAVEAAGVVLIGENGGGVGVRLKFTRREVRAINRWEGEGGVVGEDDAV